MQNMCCFQVTISHSLTFFTHKVDILTNLFLFVLIISSQHVLKGYWYVFSMNPSLFIDIKYICDVIIKWRLNEKPQSYELQEWSKLIPRIRIP